MRKRILTTSIISTLSMVLLLLPILSAEAQAADKIGWVGPVYKELSSSLTMGFKAYYNPYSGKKIKRTMIANGYQSAFCDYTVVRSLILLGSSNM